MVDRQFKVRTRAAKAEYRVCRRRRDLLAIMIATLGLGSTAIAQAPNFTRAPNVAQAPNISQAQSVGKVQAGFPAKSASMGAIRQNPYVVPVDGAPRSQIRLTSGQQQQTQPQRTPSSMRLRPIGSANGLHAINPSSRSAANGGLSVQQATPSKVRTNLHLRSIHHERGNLSRTEVKPVTRLQNRAVSPAFGVTESNGRSDLPGYFDQPGTFAGQAQHVPPHHGIVQAAGEIVETAEPITFSLSDGQEKTKASEPVRASAPLVSRNQTDTADADSDRTEVTKVAEAFEFSLSDAVDDASLEKKVSEKPTATVIRELPLPPSFTQDERVDVAQENKVAETETEPETETVPEAAPVETENPAPFVPKMEAIVDVPPPVEADTPKAEPAVATKQADQVSEPVASPTRVKPRKVVKAKPAKLEIAEGYVFGDEPEIGQAKPIVLDESASQKALVQREAGQLGDSEVVVSKEFVAQDEEQTVDFGALLAPNVTEPQDDASETLAMDANESDTPMEDGLGAGEQPVVDSSANQVAADHSSDAEPVAPETSVREIQPEMKVVDRWRPPVAVVAPPVGYQSQPTTEESGVVRHTTEVASTTSEPTVPEATPTPAELPKTQTLHWKSQTASTQSQNGESNVAQAGGVEKTALYMTRAQVRSLTIRGHLRKVSVDDRSVCQAVAAGPNQIKLIGTGNGVAELVVWASLGRNTETISRAFDIHVSDPVEASSDPASEKLSVLSQSIQHAFPNSDITIQLLTDRMVISGQCTSEEAAKKIVRMVRKTCLVPVIDELKVR